LSAATNKKQRLKIMGKIKDKLHFKFFAPKANEELTCMVRVEDVDVDEPYCWRCHNVLVDNLNYEVSVWGDIDADNHPTDENLSVQVDYIDGRIDYIKDIEIIKS